jgi:hypothetical protein
MRKYWTIGDIVILGTAAIIASITATEGITKHFSARYYSAFCVEDQNGVIACMYSKDKADYDRLQKGEQPVRLHGELQQ